MKRPTLIIHALDNEHVENLELIFDSDKYNSILFFRVPIEIFQPLDNEYVENSELASDSDKI